MYINKVDELIDNVLDNFYDKIKIGKFGGKEFIKKKKDISNMITKYVESIDISILSKLVNENGIDIIIEIIYKYIIFYAFLFIGYHYEYGKEDYVKNIIEFSKDGAKYMDPKNNALLIKYYQLTQDIKYIMGNYENLDASKYEDAISLLNELGQEYVLNNFKGETSAHNIIKTIILIEMYKKNDKKNVFNVLTQVEKEQGEFIYIDVILSMGKDIDYDTIESLLDDDEKHMATIFYDFVKEYQNGIYDEKRLKIDEKIDILLKKKYIIPIVDDILRYHKDNVRYEFNKLKKETKIKYIMEKTDKIINYYNVTSNEQKQKIKNMFYLPLADRQAMLINDTEEVRALDKLYLQGAVLNNIILDLINIRKYPYMNFKGFEKYGFSHMVENKTITCARYISFKNINNKTIQTRTGTNNINIVGLIVNDKLNIACKKAKNMAQTSGNGYLSFLNFLKNGSAGYWLFNLEKDKIVMDKYEDIDKKNTLKYMVSQIYDELTRFVYDKILNRIANAKNRNHYYFLKYLETVQKKYIQLDKKALDYKKIIHTIFYKKKRKVETGYDHNEDIIPGSSGPIIKIPSYKKDKKNDMVFLKAKKIEKLDPIEVSYLTNDAVCQHNLDWHKIVRFRNKNPTKFNEELFLFIEKYVDKNDELDYVCKSCNLLLPIKRYLMDGVYNHSQGKFITLYMPLNTPVDKLPEYEKVSKSVRYINKLVEKICAIAGINYYIGSSDEIRWRINNVTKNVVDLMTTHTKNKNNRKRDLEKYGVEKGWTQLFFFDLDDNIFIYSSKDTDKYRKIKFNNILVYIIISLILELNEKQIMEMKTDKICNDRLFKKIEPILFNKLKIIKNKKKDLGKLIDYQMLSYMIFYFSCIIAKYKIWKTNDETLKKLPTRQKIIINTTIDLLNSVLNVDFEKIPKNKNYIYKIFETKYYMKMDNIFNKKYVFDKKEKKEESEKKDKEIIKPFVLSDGPHKYTYDTILFDQCYVPRHIIQTKKNERHNYTYLSNLTSCPDGKFHKWSVKDGVLICENCNVKYDDIKNRKHNKNIEKEYAKRWIKQKENKKKWLKVKKKDRNTGYDNIVKQLNKKYKTNYVDKFIRTIQNVIGKNNNKLLIENNVYIIEHNYHGNKLNNKLIINEGDNLMQYKKDHHFFKRDVMFYVDKRKIHTQVYYDVVTRLYLGYKEKDRDYINKSDHGIFLKIKYSLINKIKLLCYDSDNIDITEYKENNQSIDYILSDVSRKRLQRIKKLIVNTNIITSQIKNNLPQNEISKKYSQMLTNMKTTNIFEFWKKILSSMWFIPPDVINLNTEIDYINAELFSTHDSQSNLLLFYFIDQINKLVDLNKEKFIKVNIVYMLIDIIDDTFNHYNINTYMNTEIKRFKHMLVGKVVDVVVLKEGSADGIYSEYMDDDELNDEDKKEKLEIDKENWDALDIDDGMDDTFDQSEYGYSDEVLHSPQYV